MDFDTAIQRKIALKLSDADVRLLSKVGSDRLTLDEVDRLAVLAQQSKSQVSTLAFEAQQISDAVFGSAGPVEQPAPDQPIGNIQEMSQSQLWELAEAQGAQRRAAKAKAKQGKGA